MASMSRFLTLSVTSSLIMLSQVGRQAQADTLTLEGALRQAISANPEIAAFADRAKAERSAVRSSYSLDNPKFGLMREQNMNFMEQQMGPMNLWSVSQTFKFPTKYYLSGEIQSTKARAADMQLSSKKLEIRQKVISAYYNLFAVNRIIELLKAQRATLDEIARSAESRHATGLVPQQDEMKAHMEQTKLDGDLITIQDEETSAQASLNALMNRPAAGPVQLPKMELGIPQIKVSLSDIAKLARHYSRKIQDSQYLAKAADEEKTLAGWQYAPDFTLNYAQAYGRNLPNAYSFGVDISIPLWFFEKQTSDYSAAAARSMAAQKQAELDEISTDSEVTSLVSKVTSRQELLEIYKTSLIPEATSTLNSSRGAYRAGRTTFLELLDSERSLYAVRVAYYRTLSEYIEDLTRLEQTTGTSLSPLPMGDL